MIPATDRSRNNENRKEHLLAILRQTEKTILSLCIINSKEEDGRVIALYSRKCLELETAIWTQIGITSSATYCQRPLQSAHLHDNSAKDPIWEFSLTINRTTTYIAEWLHAIPFVLPLRFKARFAWTSASELNSWKTSDGLIRLEKWDSPHKNIQEMRRTQML